MKKLISKKVILILIFALILIPSLVFTDLFGFFKPQISLVGETELQIKMNSKFLDPGYKAEMIGKNVNKDVKIKGKVDVNKPGVYKLTYIIKEGKKTSTITRKITVIDDNRPSIVLVGGDPVFLCPNQKYLEPGYIAIDNYDGDITKKVEIIASDNQVIYKVKDSSNNEFSITRSLVKADIDKPKLSLKGSSVMSLIIGSRYIEKGYSVSDNCTPGLNKKVTVTNNVNTNKVGTYKIKYQVKDDSGNTTEVYRTVKIKNPPKPKNSTIYLTFDDGPSNITARVLNVLKEENVKATFFVLNKSSSYNYLLNRIVNEGHSIGLHGSSHNYRKVYASVETYFNDIAAIRTKVKTVTGVDSNIIRFIGGSSNTSSRFNRGIMTTLTKEAAVRGYRYFDWNASSNDTANTTSGRVYANVVRDLGSSSIYVVLLHDMESNYKTLNALRDIIRYGKNNGYKFGRITDSTPQIKHRINN